MKKSLKCKLGFHDGETPKNCPSTPGGISDRVCLLCGKVDLMYTRYLNKSAEREEKAKKIMKEKKYEN